MPTEGRYFLKGFCCRWLGSGDKVLGGKLLSKSSINFLPDGPANCSAGEAWLKGFLGQGAHCQEGWCGQVTSCISRHPALAPALAVKIDAAYRRYFLKGFCCRWLGSGDKVFGGKLLSKSSINFLPDGPANCSAGEAWLKGFLGQGAHCQEGWCGQVTSCISRHPALAPALAVKIDAVIPRSCISVFPTNPVESLSNTFSYSPLSASKQGVVLGGRMMVEVAQSSTSTTEALKVSHVCLVRRNGAGTVAKRPSDTKLCYIMLYSLCHYKMSLTFLVISLNGGTPTYTPQILYSVLWGPPKRYP